MKCRPESDLRHLQHGAGRRQRQGALHGAERVGGDIHGGRQVAHTACLQEVYRARGIS